MPQRAFGIVSQTSVNAGDTTKVDVQVIVCIAGADIGDYGSGRVVVELENVNPATFTKMEIEAAIKTELLAHGVPFGLLNVDTVRLY